MQKSVLIEKLSVIHGESFQIGLEAKAIEKNSKQIEELKRNLVRPRQIDPKQIGNSSAAVLVFCFIFGFLMIVNLYSVYEINSPYPEVVKIFSNAYTLLKPYFSFFSSFVQSIFGSDIIALTIPMRLLRLFFSILMYILPCVLPAVLLAVLADVTIGKWLRYRRREKINIKNQQEIEAWTKVRDKSIKLINALEKNNKESIQQIKKSMQIVNSIGNVIGLSEEYRTPKAASSIGYYLSSGRSDTLKEAINLYEQELWQNEERQHRREVEQQLSEIYSQAVHNSEIAEQAAQKAKEAAMWGAAATFVLATSKQKSNNNDYHVV